VTAAFSLLRTAPALDVHFEQVTSWRKRTRFQPSEPVSVSIVTKNEQKETLFPQSLVAVMYPIEK